MMRPMRAAWKARPAVANPPTAMARRTVEAKAAMEARGRGYLEEELEDGRDGGDEAEGDGQARERACGRHLDGSEAACVTRVVTHAPSLPGPALICDRRTCTAMTSHRSGNYVIEHTIVNLLTTLPRRSIG